MSLIFVSLVVVALFFAAALKKSSKWKGKKGEKSVARLLKQLPDNQYVVLNNLLLTTEKGSTQIDHVIVSVFGIFVIETKNYQGWIFGGDHTDQWTQSIYGNKYHFYNPVYQNASHIRALKKILVGYKDVSFISIIVFMEKASLQVISREAHLIYLSKLLRTIHYYDEECLSWKQVHEIIDILCYYVNHDKNTQEQHIANVKEKQLFQIHCVANNQCPRCGGKLIERVGKYGRFMGCENYPKCRFTSKL